MTVRTHPSFTAADQAEITSGVSAAEDGSMAYAIAQRTLWQLELTSATALSANVIATQSGVGRWIRVAMRQGAGAGVAFVWNANDDLTGFDVGAGAPPSDGGDGTFDGARYLTEDTSLGDFVVVQRSPGDSGTTDIELWRLRAAIFTLQATASLAALTDFETLSVAPADPVGLAGDQYFCRFTAIQAALSPATPLDLTARLELA